MEGKEGPTGGWGGWFRQAEIVVAGVCAGQIIDSHGQLYLTVTVTDTGLRCGYRTLYRARKSESNYRESKN